MNRWSIEDLLKIKIPSDIAISPDEGFVVYTLRTLDEEAHEFRRKIYRHSLQDGAKSVQLTYGEFNDWGAKFSPDGQFLAFLSHRPVPNRDEEDPPIPHLYVLPLSGGEAKCLSDKVGPVHDYEFAPDGKSVYVITDVESTEFEQERKKAVIETKQDLTHEERSVIPRRICRIDIETSECATLYNRDYGLVEVVPAPDNRTLVFSSNRTGLTNDWDNTCLYTLRCPENPEGEEWLAELLVERKGACHTPAISPDGRFVAYIAPRFAKSEHAQSEVWLVPLEKSTPPVHSAAPLNLTETLAFVGDAMAVSWASATELLVHGEQELYSRLFLIKLPLNPVQLWNASDSTLIFGRNDGAGSGEGAHSGSGDAAHSGSEEGAHAGSGEDPHPGSEKAAGLIETIAFTDGTVDDCDWRCNGEVVAYVAQSASDPPEVFTWRKTTGEIRQVSRWQHEWQDKYRALVQEYRWQSEDGYIMDGLLILPAEGPNPEPQSQGKWPLILDIHGGPAWHTTKSFGQYLNFHWLAQLGYAVFQPNYRGGLAYGQKYLHANKYDLGGIDYRDIISGVNSLIRAGIVDEQRMGVTGGSYGGYMTNWVIGHDTRFRAAVSEFGIWNLMTDFGCSSQRCWETMYLDTYWEREALYLERSPARYVTHIETPVLIIHGDDDDNTFMANSKEMYNALLEAGKTVEFIHYPREGHGIREPGHRAHEMRKIAQWFGHFLPTNQSSRVISQGQWQDVEEGLTARIHSCRQTTEFRYMGEGFASVLAVEVELQGSLPPENPAPARPQPEGEQHASANAIASEAPQLHIGDATDNEVVLRSLATEPYQRPSILAGRDFAPVGCQPVGATEVITGKLVLHIPATARILLLFPGDWIKAGNLSETVLQIKHVSFELVLSQNTHNSPHPTTKA